MKRIFKTILIPALFLMAAKSMAQVTTALPQDTVVYGISTVTADPRMNMMEDRMKAYFTSFGNKTPSPTGYVTVQGYRLMVLNTTDRELAMKVRTQLLQMFPDQKPYMSFVSPFVRLKFGDFRTKAEADAAKRRITALKLFTNNVYVLSEKVTVKAEDAAPDKD